MRALDFELIRDVSEWKKLRGGEEKTGKGVERHREYKIGFVILPGVCV